MCKGGGQWQAPAGQGQGWQKRRRQGHIDERVSEGHEAKTGGEDSYALLQRRGEERRGFPGHSAHPLSQLFYDGARGNTSKWADATFGGNENRTRPARGAGEGASGNLPETGTRSPADSPARASLHQQVSRCAQDGALDEASIKCALYPKGAVREEARGQKGVSEPRERPDHATRT